MQTVLLNLERLRRHYELAAHTYDQISLLELSHALRMWADLKLVLPAISPAFGTTKSFVSARPSPKLCRAIRGREYVFACVPGGVVTYALKDKMTMGITPRPGPEKTKVVAATFKFIADGGAQIGNYHSIDMEADDATFGVPLASQLSSRLNFAEWLGAEAVRMAYPDASGALQFEQLSRETIIRRVANTRDGSHPSAAQPLDSVQNRYDPAIDYLFDEHVGGLPLPYLILLKIAQDIVAIAPKLMEAK
jgi:hypothetical protein